jgi:PRC-barrel domain
MENPAYPSRFRYLDADDVDDAVVDYDGLDVLGSDDRKVGDIDGFIVDVVSRRVNYIVIDSGGWFTSRRLLLPIGHATVAADRKSLRVDVARDALKLLPEFHEDRFRAFTDDELRAFERNTVIACCPEESLEDISVTSWSYDSRRHYTQPDWWLNLRYAAERLQPLNSNYQRADLTRAG